MKRMLIYAVAIVIVIVIGILVANTIVNREKTVKTGQTSVNNNTTNNAGNNVNSTNQSNELINDFQNNNTQNNEASNNETQDNETKPVSPVEIAGTDEEKAIAIVRREWGEDDSVNFVFDHKNENGEFVVAVRDINTTVAIEWYIVNVDTGTCKSR